MLAQKKIEMTLFLHLHGPVQPSSGWMAEA